MAYVESGDLHLGIIDYNYALLIAPDYRECRLNRAYAYERIGQFKNALNDVNNLLGDSYDSAYLHFYKGLILTHLRRYPDAVRSFYRSIHLGNDNLEALINIGTLHYMIGQNDSARFFLDQAFERDPYQPNALNTLSQLLLAEKKIEGAMFAIDRALEKVPNEPYFLNNRGRIYLELDSLERGLKDINKSIVLNPRNGWAYRNKGIYYLKKSKFQKAHEMFNRALEDPQFVDEVYYYQGLTYQRSQNQAAACESWKKGAENGERRSQEMRSSCN